PYQSGHAKKFDNAREAYKYLCTIYKANTDYLRDQFMAYAQGKKINKRVAAHYPYVQINVSSTARVDTRLSYGFVPTPGLYRSTVTRPDIFPDYFHEQFSLLLKNHKVPLEIGISETPIPIHFS